jgi:hypothetical protein
MMFKNLLRCVRSDVAMMALLGTVALFPFQSPAAEPVPTTAPASAAADGPVNFDDYFIDKALRIELYQTGDAKTEMVSLRDIYQEPIWPGNPKQLIPPFEAGHYAIKVFDAASNRLIFEKYFDTMFSEYRTTTPALNGITRVFETSPRIPYPKKPVRIIFERRDKKLVLMPIYKLDIDPADYHINQETNNLGDTTFDVQKTGSPHDRVDLAFLAEGYTADDKDKFKSDVERFSKFVFSVEPYKSCKEKFNVYGVFRASPERGVDQPRTHSFKSTALDASYNAFDLDRYLLIPDIHAMHRMAAQVPYDSIIVLVNSNRYGGGSICLDYCVASAQHPTAQRIMTHEFGHSFAALADEYTGDVAYNDAYPAGVEPLEPNITELLDPANIKWKAYLTPGIAIPTPEPRDEARQLQQQLQAATRAAAAQLDAAKSKGESADQIKTITDQGQANIAAAQSKLDQLNARVGAFEGGGYLKKGMYRPQLSCWMGTGPASGFCVVCQQGIRRMIDYYASDPAPTTASGELLR